MATTRRNSAREHSLASLRRGDLTPAGFAVGALAGLGLWYPGTKEIDRTYWTLLDAHVEYTKRVRTSAMKDRPDERCHLDDRYHPDEQCRPDERCHLDDRYHPDEQCHPDGRYHSHERCYTLNHSYGRSLWVTPDERYFTTLAFVGDESVTFHEGVGIDMKRRLPYVKNAVREIRYEWIASVQYEKPFVRFELTSGKSIRDRANDEPSEVLADVRAHLQRQPRPKKEESVQREFN